MPSHGLVKKRRIPDDSSDEEEEAKRKEAAEAARREEDSSDEELFTDKGPSTPHSMKLMSAIESSQAATSSGAAALDAATTKSKLPKKRRVSAQGGAYVSLDLATPTQPGSAILLASVGVGAVESTKLGAEGTGSAEAEAAGTPLPLEGGAEAPPGQPEQVLGHPSPMAPMQPASTVRPSAAEVGAGEVESAKLGGEVTGSAEAEAEGTPLPLEGGAEAPPGQPEQVGHPSPMPPMQPASTVRPSAAEVGAGEVESAKLGGEVTGSAEAEAEGTPLPLEGGAEAPPGQPEQVGHPSPMPPMQPASTVRPSAAEVGAGEVESAKLGGEVTGSAEAEAAGTPLPLEGGAEAPPGQPEQVGHPSPMPPMQPASTVRPSAAEVGAGEVESAKLGGEVTGSAEAEAEGTPLPLEGGAEAPPGEPEQVGHPSPMPPLQPGWSIRPPAAEVGSGVVESAKLGGEVTGSAEAGSAEAEAAGTPLPLEGGAEAPPGEPEQVGHPSPMAPMQPASTVRPSTAEVGSGVVESAKLGGGSTKAATEVAKNATGTYPLLGGEHLLKSQSVTPPLSPCRVPPPSPPMPISPPLARAPHYPFLCRTLMHLTTKLQVVFVVGP